MSNHIHIGTRLFSGFALILVLLGTTAGVGFYALQVSQQSANDALVLQDLLVEMQQYEQCAHSVLLQKVLGLLVQNIEIEQTRQRVDSDFQALENKMVERFTGEDAKHFDELETTYLHFIEDHDKWLQIEQRYIEKQTKFDAAGKKAVLAMENCIEAFQNATNVPKTSEDDTENVHSGLVEQARKMHVGLERTALLRRDGFDLWSVSNSAYKTVIATKLTDGFKELAVYLGNIRKTISNPDHQHLIDSVLEAVHDWETLSESILAMTEEQDQILIRHTMDDIRIAELLNVLLESVHKHAETVRKQSQKTNTMMFRVEVTAAVFAIIAGLTLAYGTLKNYASGLERVVNERTVEVCQLQTAVLDTVADMVEFRDHLTGGHNERTQQYLYVLTEELLRSGIYKEEISGWNMDFFLPSAQLHDVGKIAIPDVILNKPGKLTKDEYDIMKNHVAVGVNALEKISSKTKEHAFLRYAIAIAGAHHEKWDGTGYPLKLSGLDIPLEGRLMAIVDVYDALISKRPYKRAFTHEEACRIIENDTGTHFDPVLVDAFCRIKDKFIQIVHESWSAHESWGGHQSWSAHESWSGQ